MKNKDKPKENQTNTEQPTIFPEGFSDSDIKKINTLVNLHKEMTSLQNIDEEDKEKTLQVANNIDNLLQGYSSEEISQFAQCIAGKRVTLPGTDIVFMINHNNTTDQENKTKSKKKRKP